MLPVRIWYWKYAHYYWLALVLINFGLVFVAPSDWMCVAGFVGFLWCGFRFCQAFRRVLYFYPIYRKCCKVMGKSGAEWWLCAGNVWLNGLAPLDVVVYSDWRLKLMDHLNVIEGVGNGL
jgi:hypothetical protein